MRIKKVNISSQNQKGAQFEHLPDDIQLKIKQLLTMNDFRSAKVLYDKYLPRV